MRRKLICFWLSCVVFLHSEREMECGDRGGWGEGKMVWSHFVTVTYQILTKFRSVSRQSVIWITEVYNHIYRRSSLDFYRPLTVLSQQNKSHVHKKSVYTVIVLIKMRIWVIDRRMIHAYACVSLSRCGCIWMRINSYCLFGEYLNGKYHT